ncbi:MAG: chlorophyll a/b-binding protein [Phormidesmis sp.]
MTNPTTPLTTQQPYSEPATSWRLGFVPSAEIWNGRLAMIGFLAATLIEVFTGQGFLHFWGLLGL